MTLWWLSFADPNRPEGERFLGVSLVYADTLPQAMHKAWMKNCNPGGQIAGWSLPPEGEEKVITSGVPLDKLLTQEEVDAFGARTKSLANMDPEELMSMGVRPEDIDD